MIKLKKNCAIFFFSGSIISEVKAAHIAEITKLCWYYGRFALEGCSILIKIDSNMQIKQFLSTIDFFWTYIFNYFNFFSFFQE